MNEEFDFVLAGDGGFATSSKERDDIRKFFRRLEESTNVADPVAAAGPEPVVDQVADRERPGVTSEIGAPNRPDAIGDDVANVNRPDAIGDDVAKANCSDANWGNVAQTDYPQESAQPPCYLQDISEKYHFLPPRQAWTFASSQSSGASRRPGLERHSPSARRANNTASRLQSLLGSIGSMFNKK